MRPERLYLTDIVEAADAIQEFLEGVGEAEFLKRDLIRSAVLQKLTIIGEAATSEAPVLRKQIAEILIRDF